MNITSQITKEIKQAVLDIDPTAEVILFGSRARGDFHEESDWDVLVLTKGDEATAKLKKKEIRSHLCDLELAKSQIIFAMVHSHEFWENSLSGTPLYLEIQKDGVRV